MGVSPSQNSRQLFKGVIVVRAHLPLRAGPAALECRSCDDQRFHKRVTAPSFPCTGSNFGDGTAAMRESAASWTAALVA